jgi:hypothetical protein
MSSFRYLDDDDDDPMLSMVNLIDVFLVMIVILFIVIIQNPLNQLLQEDDLHVVRNPGGEDMEIILKEGEKLTRYQTSGRIGSGEGVKAGTTYRLPDGSLVYVPEGPSAAP